MNKYHVKGATALGVAILSSRVLQLVSLTVLARSLPESEMGAAVFLMILYTALFQLTNFGLEKYIIYFKELKDGTLFDALDTVWTLQIIRAIFILVIAGMVLTLVPYVEKYQVSNAQIFLTVLAVVLISLCSPDLSRQEREGNFKNVSKTKAYSGIVGGLVAILLAWISPSSWAVVVSQIVTSIIFLLLSFLYSSRISRFLFSYDNIWNVIKYSKHLLIISVVSYVAAQGQNLYVATLFDPKILAIYYMWYRFINIPRELVMQYSTKLLFSNASYKKNANLLVAKSHLQGFILTSIVLVPFHVYMFFHGDFIMETFAGLRYADFHYQGQIMLLTSLLLTFSSTISPFNLVFVPHITSTLRTIEALLIAGLIYLFIDLSNPDILVILYSILIVTIIAFGLRVYTLYRFIITKDRISHLRQALNLLIYIFVFLGIIEILASLTHLSHSQQAAVLSLYLFLNGAMLIWFLSRIKRLSLSNHD